jgi:hypothetical protein
MNSASTSRLTLQQVDITEVLQSRSAPNTGDARVDDAIMHLLRLLSESPGDVLTHLADVALDLCTAHSAGISLLEFEDGREVFRWRASTGKLWLGADLSMDRSGSPCGMVLDRRQGMLFAYPERHFPFPAPIQFPIVEALLVPFFDQQEPVGTLWILSHDEERQFDLEDLRIVEELCRFTALAYSKLGELGYVKDLRLQRSSDGSSVGGNAVQKQGDNALNNQAGPAG